MKTESMLSAGIDIGTTTTHLVISRIGIDGGGTYNIPIKASDGSERAYNI